MPRKSRLPPPATSRNGETQGERIARLRKERSLTQIDLAQRMGIIQALVSDYERGKLRPHAEMIVRFAQALGVSADEILGLTRPRKRPSKPSLRLMKRLQRIQALPDAQQRTLLKTIDTFLKGAER